MHISRAFERCTTLRVRQPLYAVHSDSYQATYVLLLVGGVCVVDLDPPACQVAIGLNPFHVC